MLRLVILNPRLIVAGELRLAEGATHEPFQLVDILQTILQVIEVVHVLQELLGVGVTADLHLLHHVDVGVLVFAHLQLYYYHAPSPTHHTRIHTACPQR